MPFLTVENQHINIPYYAHLYFVEGFDEPIEFEVSEEKIQAVHMLPDYTHNIINLAPEALHPQSLFF